MTDLRDMQLLASLARHRHFARAAEECGISQPAFSTRIRNMERDFGVQIVKRGNRFIGFTRDGETVLRWTRRILADVEGLRQEIETARGTLSGRLSIGAVPTALAYAARLPSRLRAVHPGLTVQLRSLSSTEIHRGLDNLSLDAGITYLDVSVPPHLTVRPLYAERYVLVAPAGLAPRLEGTATWPEASTLPLCLLTPDMQNRRILNEVFERAVGAPPLPVVETNAFTAALAQVVEGGAATIAPAMLVEGAPPAAGAVRLDLVEPVVETSIGVAIADRDPIPPAVLALLEATGPA